MNLTVDQFLDRENNVYLTVAELKIIKNSEIILPKWIGEEVTRKVEFSSAWLAKEGVKNHDHKDA
jgi:CYTH domain-containing protein